MARLGWKFFLVIGFSSWGANVCAGELTIACWNVENLFDEYREERAPDATVYRKEVLNEKLAKDARVIKELAADIVGLVEVENRHVLRNLCTEHLRDQGYKYFELIEERDPRGIDGAIISKIPFLSRSFPVEEFPRGIFTARFMVGGEPLYVLVNHWKSRIGGGADQRKRCADEVLRIIRDELPKYEGKPVAALIMGDFNDEDHDESVKTLETGGLVNTLKAFPQAERWTLPYHNRQMGKVLYQGFDHCFITPNLSNGMAVQWLESKVARFPFMLRKRTIDGQQYDWPDDDYGDHIGYSDHLPVVARLKVPDSPPSKPNP